MQKKLNLKVGTYLQNYYLCICKWRIVPGKRLIIQFKNYETGRELYGFFFLVLERIKYRFDGKSKCQCFPHFSSRKKKLFKCNQFTSCSTIPFSPPRSGSFLFRNVFAYAMYESMHYS